MTQRTKVPRVVTLAGQLAAGFLALPLLFGLSPVDWPWWARIPYYITLMYVSGSITRAVWRINVGMVNR